MSEEDIKLMQEENIKKDYFLKAMATEIKLMREPYLKKISELKKQLSGSNKYARELREELNQYKGIDNFI